MAPSDQLPRGTPLSRDAVVETAIAMVDRHGLADLTMRRLGSVLGVEAMALYHHVNGREDLLEGMVAAVTDRVRVPPREPLGPADGWQGFLQHVAHAVRTIAVEHPNLFPLIATRPPAAPWLRPPLRSLSLVEEFLDGLLYRGIRDHEAVEIYKIFTSFLLGHLLLEVSQEGASTAPPREPLDEGDAAAPNQDQDLSVHDYPTLARLEQQLRRHDADVAFEQALESLLDRLDLEVSQ
jgi:TetR/AcrR family transcriptional regulator, tetracycline repressor protein